MRVKNLGVNDSEAWNEFVKKEPEFAILQSWGWGEFKEKLGWIPFRIAVEENGQLIAGAQLLVKPLPLGLSIAYVPRGPVGAWLNVQAAGLLFAEVDQIVRKNRAIFLKIEPGVRNDSETHRLLGQHKFRKSRIENQPRATIQLDLTQSLDEILLQMRKKTRQYVHRAEREGISIRYGSSEDLPAFYQLMQRTSERDRFVVRSREYHQAEWDILSAGEQGVFLMAFYQDRLIAARIIYRFGLRAAEFHAGSEVVPGLHPNHLLVWEAMKWARSCGCVSYDMWGIPNELALEDPEQNGAVDEGNGLWGVYQFKRGFSKNIVTYIGAYDRAYIRGLYSLFGSGVFSDGAWEKIAAILDKVKLLSASDEKKGSA